MAAKKTRSRSTPDKAPPVLTTRTVCIECTVPDLTPELEEALTDAANAALEAMGLEGVLNEALASAGLRPEVVYATVVGD